MRERLIEQSHAFQRETLLELQDALHRQVRAVTRIILHYWQMLAQHGELTQIGTGLDKERHESRVTMQRLQERILDAPLREALREFRAFLTNLELPSEWLLTMPSSP